jgi:hypothetical protein
MTTDIGQMLALEAQEAEGRAEAEEAGAVEPMPGQRARRQASEPTQVYTVRIPVARLEELRATAERLGEAPSALLRRWALERLEIEQGRTDDSAVDPTSALTEAIKSAVRETMIEVLQHETDRVTGRAKRAEADRLADVTAVEQNSRRAVAALLEAKAVTDEAGGRSSEAYKDASSGAIRLGATRRLATHFDDVAPPTFAGIVRGSDDPE